MATQTLGARAARTAANVNKRRAEQARLAAEKLEAQKAQQQDEERTQILTSVLKDMRQRIRDAAREGKFHTALIEGNNGRYCILPYFGSWKGTPQYQRLKEEAEKLGVRLTDSQEEKYSDQVYRERITHYTIYATWAPNHPAAKGKSKSKPRSKPAP